MMGLNLVQWLIIWNIALLALLFTQWVEVRRTVISVPQMLLVLALTVATAMAGIALFVGLLQSVLAQ